MRFDPSLPDDRVNVSRTHPLREAALLVGGLVAVVVLLALASAAALEVLVPRLPPALEARLFAALASRPPNGAVPAGPEVQALLERLADHWPERPHDLRAFTWDEEEVNAFAFPGGGIVLTSGLLERVGSENELAFVLGHELGHFRHRDHLRGLGRELALGLVLAGLGLGGAGPAADLAGLAARLAERGFDREQERAADAFGLELLVAEYGHAAGAAAFFDALEGPGVLAAWVSTHPLGEERAAGLASLAAERRWALEGPLRPPP